MTININKMRENLLGLLFVMLIIATGIQPAEASDTLRAMQCSYMGEDDAEWFGEKPEVQFIQVLEEKGDILSVIYSTDVLDMKKVSKASLALPDSNGIDSVDDVWSVTSGDTDFFYIEFTTDRGQEGTMMLFSDYSRGMPRHLVQYFSCTHY